MKQLNEYLISKTTKVHVRTPKSYLDDNKDFVLHYFDDGLVKLYDSDDYTDDVSGDIAWEDFTNVINQLTNNDCEKYLYAVDYKIEEKKYYYQNCIEFKDESDLEEAISNCVKDAYGYAIEINKTKDVLRIYHGTNGAHAYYYIIALTSKGADEYDRYYNDWEEGNEEGIFNFSDLTELFNSEYIAKFEK